MKRADAFTWVELAEVTAGHWLIPPPAGPGGRVTAVFDNTRDVIPGALFIAIRGERVDGHNYLLAAIQAGAGALAVEKLPADPVLQEALQAKPVPVLQVPDTLKAFQNLARAHRRRLGDLTVVGITGSCGKTSTKEMLAAVLEARWPGAILKTEGNTNNHFGVPRNLLRLTPDHRGAVIEMGSNHPGEIAGLVELAAPDIGVVSNIGHAHLAFFGDLAGVAREKGSLFTGIKANGLAVYPAEAEHAEILHNLAAGRRQTTFGTGTAADLRVDYLGMCPEGSRMRFTTARHNQSHEFTWSLSGAHQALNAAAAAAVGVELGLSLEAIATALRDCRLPGMRMEVLDINGVHWVNDAYNSNPTSAQASIQWFREMTLTAPAATCVLVLGDMREQPAATVQEEHRALLRFARATLPGARLLPVGEQMMQAAPDFDLAGYPDADAVRTDLTASLTPGSWVLLKGSRGIQLETLLPKADSLVTSKR